jgi:type I restriction enzyme S subunit
VVQEVEIVVAANLARAERLRQSILKQAFEGKPAARSNDELDSLLLERIN